MKINKMTSYAIRIIGRLHMERGITTSREIIEKEQISAGAVMKVLGQLRAAGIIYSKRGRGGRTGGFAIKKSIDKVTVYDLLHAMEGEVSLYPREDKEGYHGKSEALYEELERANGIYQEELKRYSIGELFKNEEKVLEKWVG